MLKNSESQDKQRQIHTWNHPLPFSWAVFMCIVLVSSIRSCVEDIPLRQSMSRMIGETVVLIEDGIQYARQHSDSDSLTTIPKGKN